MTEVKKKDNSYKKDRTAKHKAARKARIERKMKKRAEGRIPGERPRNWDDVRHEQKVQSRCERRLLKVVSTPGYGIKREELALISPKRRLTAREEISASHAEPAE